MNKRKFASGAYRNSDAGKLEYEGFLSPIVLQRFAEYMHQHRFLEDGTMRDSDNWQQGIPRDVYMNSLWRHFMDLWLHHRNHNKNAVEDIETALCAIMFNTMGYLYEVLKEKE